MNRKHCNRPTVTEISPNYVTQACKLKAFCPKIPLVHYRIHTILTGDVVTWELHLERTSGDFPATHKRRKSPTYWTIPFTSKTEQLTKSTTHRSPRHPSGTSSQ
ncbi:hypothetical protein CRM22_000516 [Opisthorchis felineus]|uniref:Uncharacterized protein n=1 Tax=Opisthorchis felineus TaxID=147828 RepID=A0A4S2MF03_OPIFE|nr:hypothetical protein CRM22_000516 [Opisthorchis felineus]